MLIGGFNYIQDGIHESTDHRSSRRLDDRFARVGVRPYNCLSHLSTDSCLDTEKRVCGSRGTKRLDCIYTQPLYDAVPVCGLSDVAHAAHAVRESGYSIPQAVCACKPVERQPKTACPGEHVNELLLPPHGPQLGAIPNGSLSPIQTKPTGRPSETSTPSWDTTVKDRQASTTRLLYPHIKHTIDTINICFPV